MNHAEYFTLVQNRPLQQCVCFKMPNRGSLSSSAYWTLAIHFVDDSRLRPKHFSFAKLIWLLVCE